MKKISRRGQGVLETLICLPLILAFVAAIILLSYRVVVFHVASYQLHEALICASDIKNQNCKKELQNRLAQMLIGKPKINLYFTRTTSNISYLLVIELQPPLRIEQSLPRSF